LSSNLGFARGADNALATILSVAGPVLTENEKALFRAANPLGFILFARNCLDPKQLRALTQSLKDCVGRDCPILIDQEGGRVQRLKPPHWRSYPAFANFGETAKENMDQALEDLRFATLQIAEELREAGINVDCTPVLDVLMPETHDVIGDRSFSADPSIVGRLGLSVCRNMLAAGVTPIIKHIPGHGRGTLDSHLELPVVKTPKAELQKTDFAPFREIAGSDCGHAVWAMTAHIVYSDIDPDHPATMSERMIQSIIRQDIDFKGILLSDDVDMKALRAYGDAAACSVAALKAGCDVALHCSGKFEDMEKIAESVPKLSRKALESLQKAAELSTLAA
jgi:beta-N-acetylhexosaminidase